MSDHRQARSALSGIVQSMLITKHLLFVGFSLQARRPAAYRASVLPRPAGLAGSARSL